MRNQGLGLLEGPWDSITSFKWANNSSLGNLYKPRWGTISSIRSPGAMGFVVGGGERIDCRESSSFKRRSTQIASYESQVLSILPASPKGPCTQYLGT